MKLQRSPASAYLLHLRPSEWPVVLVHALVGWGIAAGPRLPDRWAWTGLIAWVVCLNGGTLAFNSAFDRDAGDIAFLRNPPPAPAGLAAFGAALMLIGIWATRDLPHTYRVLYAVCAVMSVLYSMPPIRLKAIAGADWLVNMLGFGTFTPWAAWALTGRPLHGADAAVLWAFTPLFAALYPLTQLYQIDDDRSRGDRTLAVRLGPRGALSVAVFSTGIAFGMWAMAAWRTGWNFNGNDVYRWIALAVAALAWMVVLLPWYAAAQRWASRQHQQAMYHALAAWALTDIAIWLGWGS